MLSSRLENFVLQNKFFLFLVLVVLTGCGDTISSKKYNATFLGHEPLTLHVDNSLDYHAISSSLVTYGFTIDTSSTLHIYVTTNPLKSNCALSSSHIAKENFIRMSIVKNEAELYRVQLNKKEEIELDDIKKVVKKMRDEMNSNK
ncbi:MAG: hypothetical protein J0647_10880 [Campylobacteraceae bacterium]|nr:hypothetical protein [Campylobacteraceae bacterium]